MAYCSVAEVAAYGNFNAAEVTAHTALLTALISRAQGQIERMTGRVFEIAEDTTRTFDVYSNRIAIDGLELLVLDDLASVTSIVNAGETLATNQYNASPNTGYVDVIRLKASSGLAWSLGEDDPLQITGRWGYSVTPPEAIKQATIELVMSMWLRRDQVTVNGPTTVSVDGKIILSSKVPEAVVDVVAHYKRFV